MTDTETKKDLGQCANGDYHHLWKGEWIKNKECKNTATIVEHKVPLCWKHVSGYHRCGWKS